MFERFDRIRIINLQARADRRAEMLGELRKIGMPLEGRVQFHTASSFQDAGEFESPGCRGCFHSHLNVLTEAAQAGESVLILEDDVDFTREVQDFQLGPFDVFYGGYLRRDGRSLMGSHFIGFDVDAAKLAAAYLGAMSQRPRGSKVGGPMHVDGAYSWFLKEHPDLNLVIAEPQLGYQRSSRTDVHALRFYDRLPGLRFAAGIVRSMRRAAQRR